jgi:hypothetical protein
MKKCILFILVMMQSKTSLKIMNNTVLMQICAVIHLSQKWL